MTTRRKVSLATLGGTITMTAAALGQGVVPTTTGAGDLLAAVPGLEAIADLYVATLLRKPGASLGIDDVLAVLDWAQTRLSQGAEGVVHVRAPFAAHGALT
jgi:L-asparaginase